VGCSRRRTVPNAAAVVDKTESWTNSELDAVHGLAVDNARLRECSRTGPGRRLDTDMFAARSWTWTVRGYGQTAVVVTDWLRTRTDRGRGCGLDKASRPDNGADISPLNRDSFADIGALITQGVWRPTLNPHKSCGHLRSI